VRDRASAGNGVWGLGTPRKRGRFPKDRALKLASPPSKTSRAKPTTLRTKATEHADDTRCRDAVGGLMSAEPSPLTARTKLAKGSLGDEAAVDAQPTLVKFDAAPPLPSRAHHSDAAPADMVGHLQVHEPGGAECSDDVSVCRRASSPLLNVPDAWPRLSVDLPQSLAISLGGGALSAEVH